MNPQPRVLIATEFSPSGGGGGGVLLRHLLRGLDWNQVYWWSLLSSQEQPFQMSGRHRSFNLATRFIPNRRLVPLKGWVLENLLLPRAAADLLAYGRAVRPDFILALAHRWVIPVLYRARPTLRAHWHLALHDMPDSDSMISGLGEARAHRFLRMTDALYTGADSRAVIGPGMAADMQSRTGIACRHFFRCAVEPEAMARLATKIELPPATASIRIGYAGTIVAEETFGRLVGALRAVRERLGRPVELHLYTWHNYRDRSWYDPSVIVEHGPKSEAEIGEAMRRHTWGLVLMNLDDTDPRYNRLSFPCKFTASLAAGLPLICLGHRESALVELVRHYELGVTVTDAEVETLVERLCVALPDFSRFPLYRAEALRCAKTEFNAERNRAEMRAMIESSRKTPGLG